MTDILFVLWAYLMISIYIRNVYLISISELKALTFSDKLLKKKEKEEDKHIRYGLGGVGS